MKDTVLGKIVVELQAQGGEVAGFTLNHGCLLQRQGGDSALVYDGGEASFRISYDCNWWSQW